jgi:hypothetical protein
MPQHDDKTILDNATLIRAVLPEWILTEEGQERLTSATFKDGHLEASCFIAEQVGGLEGFERDILPVLEEELGLTLRIATVAASDVRKAGLWIYRKPEEFHDDPAHVVVCPSDGMSKSRYGRQAGNLKGQAHLQEGK